MGVWEIWWSKSNAMFFVKSVWVCGTRHTFYLFEGNEQFFMDLIGKVNAENNVCVCVYDGCVYICPVSLWLTWFLWRDCRERLAKRDIHNSGSHCNTAAVFFNVVFYFFFFTSGTRRRNEGDSSSRFHTLSASTWGLWTNHKPNRTYLHTHGACGQTFMLQVLSGCFWRGSWVVQRHALFEL